MKNKEVVLSSFILGSMALSLNVLAVGAKKYNILYIMSDDHSYQAISAYQHQLGKYAATKNIDRIANEGTLFLRAYVANSICSPARATLLSGQHSHLNGKYTNRGGINYKVNPRTMPVLLQENGYQTAIVGKWHLKTTPQGFDYSDVLNNQGEYYNPTFIKNGGKKRIEKGYNTDITTTLALNWLKKDRKKKKPFAMLLHYKAAHRSFSPAVRHLDLFNDVSIPMPENYFDDYSTRGKPLAVSKMSVARDYNAKDLKIKFTYDNEKIKKYPEKFKIWKEHYAKENKPFTSGQLTDPKKLAEWKCQRYLKDYLRVIRGLDENIGRVLDYLKESGLENDTIVIYTSDQGFYMGEHGWFDKRYMFEESFRTPLLIRIPGQKSKGVKNSDLVQNIDFAPTILDYAGVTVPTEMQGVSLRPLLEGKVKSDNWRKSLYYHYYETPSAHRVPRHDGVTTKRWKLINFYQLKKWELFDLEKDPSEMNNLYGKIEYKEITEKMKTEYEKLKKQYKVPKDVYTTPWNKLKSYK